MDLDNLTNDMEKLKISALSKVRKVNSSVNSITIGPNRSPLQQTKEKTAPVTKLLKKSIKTDTPTDNNSIRNILKELEMQRKRKVEDATKARLQKFNEHSKQLQDDNKRELLKRHHAFIQDMERKQLKIMEELEQYDAKSASQQAKMVQQYEELALQRRKQEEAIQEKERQRRILNSHIEKIRAIQKELNVEYQKIVYCLKTFIRQEQLKKFAEEKNVVVKRSLESFEEIISRCLKCEVTEPDVHKASEILNTLKSINAEAYNLIEEFKKKQEENRKAVEEKLREQASREPPKPQPAIPIPVPIPQPVVPTSVASASVINNKLTKYVSLNNLKIYTETIETLERHTQSYQALATDAALKQFKFDCKKAVNVPVNAISAVNTEHLLDKYVRLHKLLSGQTVVVNEKNVNVSQHPQGVAFCMDLLASKLVLQGDLMISSQPEAAFCYATIIVSLWNDFPPLGELILGHFYKSCPYLVPYYIPRNVDESDEEFYKKQGYQYNGNGEVEKQDKFLKRMTGIVRLYAAILITKPKRSQNNVISHNLSNGWRLMASLLRLEPRVDITATVLHTFLETVGFEMEAKYGKMFKKLMIVTIQQFLPKCKEKSTGGAGARLELLLTEYLKKGRFDKPTGYTANAYW